MAAIKVYGANWCPGTRATRAHLKLLKLPYDYIDIDHDREAAAWVASQNDGKERKPTLDVAGEVLTAPSDEELDEILQEKGFLG